MRTPRFFGLDPITFRYDPSARPPKFVAYTHHFGGRARIRVEEHSMPLPAAQGLRSALRASLALVEAEILEAGGELEELA